MLWMIAISTTRQKLSRKKNSVVHYFSDKNKIKMLGVVQFFSIGHLNHQVTTPSKAMQMGNLGNDLKEGVVLSIELPLA